MNHRCWLPAIGVLLLAGSATAQEPGLGNLQYQPSELFDAIGFIQSLRGHGNVAMVNGYLMVIYSFDSGGSTGDGGIEFWDVSNPPGSRDGGAS